jgi:hypothetical protein
MPVVDSRVSHGVLKFTASGGSGVATAFECQITSVAITPNVEDGDSQEVLCGDKVSTAAKTSDTLDFSAISDFASAAGLQAFSWKHRGETVSFEVQFDGTAADKWAGKVTMKALTVGGAVGEQVVVDASLPIVSLTPPTAFGDGLLHTTPPPSKGAAKDGDVFAAEATVTASDATNAAKLAALGYTAATSAAWKTGQRILIGGYAFHWDGTAWAAGAAS